MDTVTSGRWNDDGKRYHSLPRHTVYDALSNVTDLFSTRQAGHGNGVGDIGVDTTQGV